ncbi:MAG: hypothetical protein KF784_05070 [Fimbriimonadaceae bacterium]|nr:hypothetical protein [Fimbriimonadaceae bacterium]
MAVNVRFMRCGKTPVPEFSTWSTSLEMAIRPLRNPVHYINAMEPSILRRFVNQNIAVVSISNDHTVHGILQAVDNIMILVNVEGQLMAFPLATVKFVKVIK